jgi:hypothetical protein
MTRSPQPTRIIPQPATPRPSTRAHDRVSLFTYAMNRLTRSWKAAAVLREEAIA